MLTYEMKLVSPVTNMTDNCTIHYLEDDRSIPNNPELPLLICLDALPSEQATPGACKRLLRRHGWSGAWVNGIYSYHHYHSTAHEVLAVISGAAEVVFGGEEGEKVRMTTGDVVYIPAGVGHCCISSSPDFSVVGAYPEGQTWDLCTGKPGERPQVLRNIEAVPLPARDAITGEREPLLDYWS